MNKRSIKDIRTPAFMDSSGGLHHSYRAWQIAELRILFLLETDELDGQDTNEMMTDIIEGVEKINEICLSEHDR